MGKLAFGLILMVIGIGGTFLTLIILIWSIELLKKLFPLEPAQAQPRWQAPYQPWREKLPLDSIKGQWTERSAQFQRVSGDWLRQLPLDRLQSYWNETLRLERIASPDRRRAALTALQARIFGRASPPPLPAKTPPDEGRDHPKP